MLPCRQRGLCWSCDSEVSAIERGVDPRYFRLPEIDELVGDATTARQRLDWLPEILVRRVLLPKR